MRVNVQTGAWCCMACNAHGGDVLAFHMAHEGMTFVQAAQALGCWVEDGGKPHHQRRPKALSAREALELIKRETNLVALEAARLL